MNRIDHSMQFPHFTRYKAVAILCLSRTEPTYTLHGNSFEKGVGSEETCTRQVRKQTPSTRQKGNRSKFLEAN